jgi:hypothetical protein
VGVYVKSQTKVENFELSRDRIIAEAQGIFVTTGLLKRRMKTAYTLLKSKLMFMVIKLKQHFLREYQNILKRI